MFSQPGDFFGFLNYTELCGSEAPWSDSNGGSAGAYHNYLLFLSASMAVARINPKTAITPSKPGVLAAFCAVFAAAVEFVVLACVEADDARVVVVLDTADDE